MQYSDQVTTLESRTLKLTFDEMEEVYSDNAQSYDIVKHQHRQFKCSCTQPETTPTSGRQDSAIDNDIIHRVEAAILEDFRITIQKLTQNVKINVGLVEKIIHDNLQMRKLSSRFTECSHVFIIEGESIDPRLFWQCAQ